MSIKKQNITFESTGRDFDLNSNSLGQLTSVLITPESFSFPETDLQDIDTMFQHMIDGNIFPIHRVYDVTSQNKEITYEESIHDFSYPIYRGKDIFTAKYNIRLDYRHLISQFNGYILRIILVYNNKYFLTTETGSNVQGYKTNLNIEDVKIIEDWTTPLRIELLNKTERDSEIITDAGYLIKDIDKRIINVEATATETDMTLSLSYMGEGILGIIKSDITVIDDVKGNLAFTTFTPGSGIYLLSGFSVGLTGGCVIINADAYLGKGKYIIEIVVTYANWLLMSDDNFVTMGGDNLIFVNTI